jgi:hypothetical protein
MSDGAVVPAGSLRLPSKKGSGSMRPGVGSCADQVLPDWEEIRCDVLACRLSRAVWAIA